MERRAINPSQSVTRCMQCVPRGYYFCGIYRVTVPEAWSTTLHKPTQYSKVQYILWHGTENGTTTRTKICLQNVLWKPALVWWTEVSSCKADVKALLCDLQAVYKQVARSIITNQFQLYNWVMSHHRSLPGVQWMAPIS